MLSHTGSHKACHRRFDKVERYHFEEKGGQFSYGEAKDAASDSAGGAMDPPRDLSPKEKGCIAAQLDAYHKQATPDGPGVDDSTPLRSDLGKRSEGTLDPSQQAQVNLGKGFVSMSGP